MAKEWIENYNKRFVNPYNFIPLMGTCSRSDPRIDFNDSYTGYFDCKIKLLTPLFIPNTSSSTRLLSKAEKSDGRCKTDKWKGYDFYSYDDWSQENSEKEDDVPPPQNPVIPGSEIRGAVRSVYEAAFNGCMSSVSEDRVLFCKTNMRERPKNLKNKLSNPKIKKKVGYLLKENGGFVPCSSKKLCPACQIFGMVEKSKQPEQGNTYAYGSKVRITDAVLIEPIDDNCLFENPIILPELGEPKPKCVEFYTEPPYQEKERSVKGNGFWTYDYRYIYNYKLEPTREQPLRRNEPKLRGRKYYWHSSVNLKEYEGNELSAMKQRIRPMKALEDKPLFQFRVYFERLTKEQLNQLKWAIDFGDPECAHKIGRAKPLGFGSVQLSVNDVHLRNIHEDTGLWEMEKIEMKTFFDQSIVLSEPAEIVQLMANWEKRPKRVEYPSVEQGSGGKGKKVNETASHQWFTANKKGNTFKKVLPKAKEDARKDLKPEKALYTLRPKEQK